MKSCRLLSTFAVLGLISASQAQGDDAKPVPPPATPNGLIGAQLAPVAVTALPGSGAPAAIIAAQAAANAAPGPRTVPGRVIPVPGTVSAQFKAQVSAPYRTPDWDADPKSSGDWKALVSMLAAKGAAKLPALREKLGVTSTPMTIGGVKAFLLQPKSLSDAHQNKIVLAIHGGGFVYNPGEAGTLEGVLVAGLGGFKVIAIDYRMPPDYPFPAAMDDAMAVYKALLKDNKPGHIGVVGTSAGGGMALSLCLRAKAEGVPLPAVMAPGTPEADMTGAGDTLKTNEWLDNVIVSNDGYILAAQKIYAAGHDLKDPQLSPIFGDFAGLPPAILTSGTRDLFLSNTVRVHRKLRQAGIEAELQVFEGMSHAQYLFNTDAPETKEAFAEIAAFFDKHFAH